MFYHFPTFEMKFRIFYYPKNIYQIQVSSPITKYTELEPALCQELKKIVEAVVVPGKGLLACDESPASLQKRFDELGVENTEINRRNYRQMLFSADKVIIL